MLIEADFAMPTYVTNFREMDIDLYFNDYLNQKEKPLVDYIYPDIASDFGIIACSSNIPLTDKIFSNDQSWYYAKLRQLEGDLKELDYDVIIFDMGPGFSLFLVNTLFIASSAILVSRPDVNSINGTLFLLDTVYSTVGKIDKVQINVVINQVPELDKFNDLITQWQNEIKIKFSYVESVYTLPLDAEIIYQSAINKYFIEKESPVYSKFVETAESLINFS